MSTIMQGEYTDGKQPQIERDDFPELRRTLRRFAQLSQGELPHHAFSHPRRQIRRTIKQAASCRPFSQRMGMQRRIQRRFSI